MKEQLKVYVGCALTHVPKIARSKHLFMIDKIKAELKTRGYLVLDFLSAIKEDPGSEDVYKHDIKCLEEADCVLALCDYPGIGLGYEICYSVMKREIPTFVAITDENNLSKLLKGVSENNYKYVVFDDIFRLVDDFDNFVKKFYEKNN